MRAQVIKISDARQHSFSGLDAACVGLLLAYFLHFALPALRAGFGEDEMMNLYSYWFPGVLRSIRANFCFWSISYPQRPAGALYYLPLYHFFSLDPPPYRAVQIGCRRNTCATPRLPQLNGYEWVLAESPTTDAAVLQLTPSS